MNIPITLPIANEIIQIVRKHLLELDGITDDIIDRHLQHYKQRHQELKSIMDVNKAILYSARNKQRTSNIIDNKYFDDLSLKLCDFNPNQILKQYSNNPDEVFDAIAPNNAPRNNNSVWVQFSKSVISTSRFLANYQDINHFLLFTCEYTNNPTTRIGLPLVLEKAIDGIAFTLACDFLKENICSEYIKPDGHIVDFFKHTLMSKPECLVKDYPYHVFQCVIEFSDILKMVPYEIDKLFWLAGSGNFYLVPKRIPKRVIDIKKKELINKIKDILRSYFPNLYDD